MRYLVPVLPLCAAAALPGSAVALDIGIRAGVESEYTTNSGRSSRDEVEEWIHQPGVNVTAAHDGPNLALSADYAYERRLYQQDLYDDESVTTGRANLLWNAIPQRLDFTVTNARTETPIRSISPATPDNRQETMTTQAGPTLRFRTRGEDEFQLQYLYGDRSTEETFSDSETHTITARYNLVVSPVTQWSLEAVNNQVQFENPFAPDLDAKIGRLTWLRAATDVSVSVMGGYNKTERTLNRDDVDGAIYAASVDWQARPNTAITLTAGRDITDRAASLGFGSTGFGENLNETNSDLNEVFTATTREIAITQQIGNNTVTLTLFNSEEDYEDVLRDNDNTGVRLGLSRALSPRTTLSLALGQRTQDFTDEDQEVDELDGSLLVSWELGRRLRAAAGVRYEEREGESAIGSRSEYDEWVGFIRLDYLILGQL